MQKERIYGTIFLPESPDNRIAGVWLNISATSIYIEVPLNTFKNESWQIILGEFNGIDEITFVNCHSGGGSSGAGGTFQRIIISYLIKGLHAFSQSDLSFNKIVLTSPVLTKWIIEKDGIEAIDNNTYKIPEEKEITKVEIENINIVIRLGHSTSYSSDTLQINKVCSISLESSSLVDISIFSGMMTHLKKLILFITHKNPEFKEYFLFKDKNSDYQLINTNESLRDDRFTQGIQVRYSNVKNSFAEIIKKWFELKKLHSVIDLSLEKCYNTEMSMQGFFLSVCMSIEIFQNNFGKKTSDILDREICLNKEKISESIQDENLAIWFKEKSQYWNNPTFKDRFMQFKDEVEKLINGVFNLSAEEFIDKIKEARNDIVHRGTYKKQFTGSELFLAAKIIEFVLRLEMMKLIGIDTMEKPNSLFDNAKNNIDVLVRINKKIINQTNDARTTKHRIQAKLAR